MCLRFPGRAKSTPPGGIAHVGYFIISRDRPLTQEVRPYFHNQDSEDFSTGWQGKRFSPPPSPVCRNRRFGIGGSLNAAAGLPPTRNGPIPADLCAGSVDARSTAICAMARFTRAATRSPCSNWCSQILNTLQFFRRNCLVTKRSRARLLSSLLSQNCLFPVGRVPCSGHPCQKQPSTKTASFIS